ncbi:GIY-YIG nuclease family protein [Salinirussus salinus]|jgi:putative endonuclease|uniref:GIY-YIG nuclease family protein n=1 Tax=Salinirussus salinus TaxID=1198300 RepID=UPI00135A44BC|nr:GIY-YIG nuclease family protein [Salinirussus salinus]
MTPRLFSTDRYSHSNPVHYVYVLRCADDTLYTGYTTDVDRRVAEHDAGEGAKYTRGRAPVDLVYTESFGSRSAALSREHEIKALSRAEKERLVGEE